MNHKLKYIYSKSGFTLIELMVASSIFMIIVLMAMGALLTTSNSAKRALALRTSMDNINFAMETMTRSIRMGTDYECVTSSAGVSLPGTQNADCSLSSGAGGGAIIFTPPLHAVQRDTAYQRVARLMGRYDTTATYALQRCSTTSCEDLVSPNIDVQKLSFYVNGSDPIDKVQPSVYILMKGTINIKGEKISFAVQTMTSQRNVE